ncbi:GTP pyrophosphokinase [Pseudomonas wadenswilerensis]
MARKPKTISAPNTPPPFNPNHPDDLWIKNPSIIKKFLDTRPEFEKLCTEVEYILNKKVTAASIHTSFLGGRTKTLNSFIEKVQRKSYSDPFNQLDDLAGVRVVCLYNNDVTTVVNIIRDEFKIIDEIDKLKELDNNKFGYIGHHLIVKLGNQYSGARYDDLRELRCEIQVRTVVQDAWATIQHHMVYKKESQVPSSLIRKLNGLAGLFETADDQFEFIRMQRDTYLDTVRGSMGQTDDFLEHELNYDSLVEFLHWKYGSFPIEEYTDAISKILDLLSSLALSKLKELNDIIAQNEEFSSVAISSYYDFNSKSAEAVTQNTPLPEIEAPILAAVALSGNPNWRASFPWGGYWPLAFEHADDEIRT